MQFLKSLIMVVFVMTVVVALSACNTMEGAGKDVEAAGESIQDAAD